MELDSGRTELGSEMQKIVWSMENEGFIGHTALARCCRLVFCNGILSMQSGEAMSAIS
jgi:hypothetical protein